MGNRKGSRGQAGKTRAGIVPDFDVALWGYDRQQVDRCLEDMATRLENALGRLDSVEALQSQLCEAQLEIEELRMAVEDRPGAAGRLSKIMAMAELLRNQATEDAKAIRSQARTEVARSGSSTT